MKFFSPSFWILLIFIPCIHLRLNDNIINSQGVIRSYKKQLDNRQFSELKEEKKITFTLLEYQMDRFNWIRINSNQSLRYLNMYRIHHWVYINRRIDQIIFTYMRLFYFICDPLVVKFSKNLFKHEINN